MRFLLGALIFILIVVFMHDAASGEAELHCVPALKPPPPNCTVVVGQPFGKGSLECDRA